MDFSHYPNSSVFIQNQMEKLNRFMEAKNCPRQKDEVAYYQSVLLDTAVSSDSLWWDLLMAVGCLLVAFFLLNRSIGWVRMHDAHQREVKAVRALRVRLETYVDKAYPTAPREEREASEDDVIDFQRWGELFRARERRRKKNPWSVVGVRCLCGVFLLVLFVRLNEVGVVLLEALGQFIDKGLLPNPVKIMYAVFTKSLSTGFVGGHFLYTTAYIAVIPTVGCILLKMLFYLFDEAEPTNREDIPAEYEERLRDIGTRQATRRALRLERFVESQRLQVQHSKKDVPLLLDAHTETEAATCQEKVDVAAAQVGV